MDAIRQWVSDFVNILTRGQPFGWNNVLDVLIVAVFIYYVLLLIRGTRAVQLLIGVMVLVLIYFVATSLHLTLTAGLLASIFMTRSPLHDGAVIVRGGQILAAACLLPLEENTDRGAHRYGMRHRAALSISAQTDAIVVVVSEETQAISIAAGGRIIGALDEERLRRVLSSLLRTRVQPLPFRSKAS